MTGAPSRLPRLSKPKLRTNHTHRARPAARRPTTRPDNLGMKRRAPLSIQLIETLQNGQRDMRAGRLLVLEAFPAQPRAIPIRWGPQSRAQRVRGYTRRG